MTEPTSAEKAQIIAREFDRRSEQIGELMGENDRLKRTVAMLAPDVEHVDGERCTPSVLAGPIEMLLNRNVPEVRMANLYGDPPRVDARCGIVVRFTDGNELLVQVTESPAAEETGYSVLPGMWAQCVVDAGLAEFTAGAPDIQHHQRIRWTPFDSNPLPQEDPQ